MVNKMANENRRGNVVKEVIALAHRKGLKVEANVFCEGYCITLPNGGAYHAKSKTDMVLYVRSY
jgi:hypothetical protein